MEYPPPGHVSHHRHHNHNRREEDEEYNNAYPPPPPPPFSHSPSYGAPPPHHYPHLESSPPPFSHSPPPSYGAPPSHHYPHLESSPPQHETGGHHRFQPHVPGFIGSHFHHEYESAQYGGGGSNSGGGLGSLESKPSLQFRCKAGGDRYAVGIRDGKVVLTHPDFNDLTQHWCKDERYSTKVKDKDGYPSFILVNKGTAQAVKHSVSCHPVALTPYHPDVFDESVLWTEGKDLGSGFRTIRTVNNIHLVMDAWNADKDHGGIHDGTLLALYETWEGDNQNQQWNFTRHYGGLGSLESEPSLQFRCKAGGDRYAVGIRDGKVVLTHPDSSDPTQHWCKDERYSTKVKDKDGYPSFILVNKGTAQAVKHSVSCHPVALTPYHPDVFDESVLWTEGKDLGSGFRTIRTVNNIHLVMDAWNADKDHGGIHDGTLLALYETWKGDNQNQQWNFTRH